MMQWDEMSHLQEVGGEDCGKDMRGSNTSLYYFLCDFDLGNLIRVLHILKVKLKQVWERRKYTKIKSKPNKKKESGTSLVAQWLRIHLPM